MSFFKKLFQSSEKKEQEEIKKKPVALSIDDSFVHNFINKGGKFIYCLSPESVSENLMNILLENNWDTLSLKRDNLKKFTKKINVNIDQGFNAINPFFTTCEFLIAEDGSILFSANQTAENKLSSLNENFIVLATASQIVESNRDSLTAIKAKYPKNIPGNISSIKNFTLEESEDNFLNYGANNSKNLYLLLLEDF